MNIKKIFFYFFFIFFFLFCNFYKAQSDVLADTVLFQDNFEDANADGWEEYDGWGGWQVKQLENSNFVYEGAITLYGYPENPAYSINGNAEWTDYVFEVDIKGIEGVDKVVGFRFRSISERYFLNIVSQWSGGGNIVNIHKHSPLQTAHIFRESFINYPNRWYRLKIAVTNINENTTNIKVYIKDLDNNIDHGLIVDFDDKTNPITSGKICLHMWPGGPVGIGSVTKTQFDNVLIKTTLFPSLDPFVLLPGMGASWNHEAMILGIHKEPEEWYMTPFVKVYDGLIQTLENAGYENTGNDRTLFIFNYDWRQPIETTADQLKEYIENTVDPPAETKIDLIGHSLGGMVARTYLQNNPDNQVDQLITIGSPNKGAPKIYYLWEGADLDRTLLPWQRISAGILLYLNKKDYQNNTETIQTIAPVLKDLLPTFPYLKYDSVEKPLSEMNQRNSWLEDLNQLPLPEFLTSALNTIFGIIENSTLRWINVENRNRFDRLLGKWEDGRPVGEEFNNGDKTVLVESAQLEGANVVELSELDHQELVKTEYGQQAIVELLEVLPSEIVLAPSINYEPSLVFQLASPATSTVLGPDGWQIGEGVENNIPDAIYSPENKLIIISNPKEGEYRVQVNRESDGGDFRLLIGKLLHEGDIWQEFEGQTNDEPKIFTTTFSQDPVKNKLELLKLAKQKLELMRNKMLKSKKPFRHILASVIKWKIRQINRPIRLMQRGKENRAQAEIKAAILNIIFFEKNLKYWTMFYSPELQQELLKNLRLAKDHLLQAYEME